MDIVESILNNSNYKSIEVKKDIEVEFDLGNLLASDSNPINEDAFRADAEECLKNIARDNAQLLIAQLWKLPTDQVDDVYVAKLPPGTTRLPREKKIPSQKKPTKWETFAKQKGIQKKKKSRMIWDEQLKEYRPRWGYKRTNDDTKEWVHEVPDNADPYEDQFEKRMKAKKERIAKNELQRLRNITRNMKGKVAGVTMMPVKSPGKQELSVLQTVAKKSTASLGKFTESLPKEKSAKHLGKKRKFESNFGDLEAEKKKSKAIFERVKSNQSLIDANRAANLLKVEEETARSKKNKGGGEEEEGDGKKSKKSNKTFRPHNSKKGQFKKGKNQPKMKVGKPGGKPRTGKGKPHSSKGKGGKGKQKSRS